MWHREVIQLVPSESYGECSSDSFWVYFGLLFGILVVSEATTVFFAIKTSDIQQDLSDCNSVLMAIAFHLQAWIVGVPILAVLGKSSVDATYLGRVFLIWIFSTSAVLFIVWPKVFKALELRRQPELANRDRVRVSIYSPGAKATNRSSTQLSAEASSRNVNVPPFEGHPSDTASSKKQSSLQDEETPSENQPCSCDGEVPAK